MNTPLKKRIGILDYGAGNFGSVKRAIEALNVEPISVDNPATMKDIDQLIFPGVGSAEQAMVELRKRGLDKALKDFAASGCPLLGICVGMQVLGEWSEEGRTECLGLLPYQVKKFTCSEPVPHMGWNSLEWNAKHPAMNVARENLVDQANFYFVHSFAAFVDYSHTDDNFLLASANYGGQSFAAFVAQKNIWGAQCHVEKSGRAGLAFLKNFLNLRGGSC